MRLAIPILALLAAACTPMQWVRPDASTAQAAADEQECQQAAWHEAQNRSYLYDQRTAPIVGPGFTVWNSGAFVDPFGYPIQEEGWLRQFCMESRGYTLVPVPAPKQ